MSTAKRGPGRPVDVLLQAKAAVSVVLARVTGSSVIECARMLAQADGVELEAALSCDPIDAKGVLDTIAAGAWRITVDSVATRNAEAKTEAESQFPMRADGVSSPDRDARVAGKRSRLSTEAATFDREHHEKAKRIEHAANAIVQTLKTSRKRVEDLRVLEEAFAWAIAPHDTIAKIPEPEPWIAG